MLKDFLQIRKYYYIKMLNEKLSEVGNQKKKGEF